jgi:hypothetical protein
MKTPILLAASKCPNPIRVKAGAGHIPAIPQPIPKIKAPTINLWSILMFVMLGAIAVAFIPFQRAIKKPKTIFNEQIQLPTNTQIDQRLIV